MTNSELCVKDRPLSNLFFNINKSIEKHPFAFLILLVSITVIFVFHKFIFERQGYIYCDIGSDTENVYYPFFHTLLNKIITHDFTLWTFEYGTGTNILTRQADVGSIFTYIAFLFGEKGIKYLLVFTQILKIYTCASLCWLYISHFKFSVLPKILVSYAYAFNGFLILWGQHYFFGGASVCIILLLLTIEVAFADRRKAVYVAFATCASLCTSYYIGYMILLFAGIYTVLRSIYLYKVNQYKDAIKTLLIILAAVVVGFMLSAFIFIPSAIYLLSNSDRVSGGTIDLATIVNNIFSFHDLATNATSGLRMYSNNIMGTVAYSGVRNYYEAPQYFFTSLNVFVIIIYFLESVFNIKKDIKKSLLGIGTVLIVLYSVVNPLISIVFNGFTNPFDRYTFVLMPLFCLWHANVFDKIIKNKLKYKYFELFAATIISTLILYFSFKYVGNKYNVAKYSLYACFIVIFAFAFISFFLSTFKNKTLRVFSSFIIVALIAMNVNFESYVTTNCRWIATDVHNWSYTGNESDSVKSALSYLKETDSSFYRIEKTFYNVSCLFNDSMIEHYNSISTYNSVQNYNVAEFARKICPELIFNGLTGYNNFNQIYHDAKINSLLGVKYILSYEELDDINEYEFVGEFDSVLIYRNKLCDNIGRFFVNTISTDEYDRLISNGESIDLLKTLVVDDEFASNNENNENIVYTLDIKQGKNSSQLLGTITNTNDGWLFVAIPFENGWTASVDGENVEIVKADYGYSAIKLESGTHSVEFNYKTPYLSYSIAISLFGLLITLVWLVSSVKQIKKESKNKKI